MKYRSCFGLELPVLGLGAWSFGSDEIWWGKQKTQDSQEVLEHLLEYGITLIDTAPIYGRGKSESIIGDFFKKTGLRDKFVVATKCGLSADGKNVFHDLKKGTILKELDESRKRLQTDVIDIYQIHYPDPSVSIEKIAETMNALLDSKKIRTVGLSNFSLEQVLLFKKHSPLHFLQMKYNLLCKDVESSILPFCLRTDTCFLAYSPLENGILTGKYHFSGKRPDGLLRRKSVFLNDEKKEETRLFLERTEKEARKEGLSLAQFALQWVTKQAGVTTTLAGCRNIAQLAENVFWKKED